MMCVHPDRSPWTDGTHCGMRRQPSYDKFEHHASIEPKRLRNVTQALNQLLLSASVVRSFVFSLFSSFARVFSFAAVEAEAKV